MRYVIIGGSIAGISALKEIRGADISADITVISPEKKPYYRPVIPLLIEKDDMDITFADDPMERYDAQHFFDMAKGVDAVSKKVVLSSGKRCGYDRLLIATGSSPILPGVPGIEGSGVFPLRTIEDSFRIKASAKSRRNAVVMGGGFVGTKASVALHHLGLKVTVIERMGQLLPQKLDRRGARIVSEMLKKEGIGIITNDSASEIIRKSGTVRAVRLSSGDILDADMVVVAVGAKPNVDAFKDSGVRINQGILIDESFRTNIPEIYAAGDVAEYIDLITGEPAVSALWTNAEEMGRLAGRSMTGTNIKYQGFLSVMNATEIFNVPVISIGLIEPEGEGYDVIVEDTVETYRRLVFKDDVLVGVVFIGDVSNAGIYTNLIKNRIPVGSLKEEAINGNLGYINFVNAIPQQTLSI